MTRPDDEILDRRKLDAATGGDDGLVRELLAMLRRELPERMARLDRALQADDRAAAGEMAHKMRGAAAYTGATRLDTAAAELKRRIDEDREPGAALGTLRDRVGELLQALEDRAGRPPSGSPRGDQASSSRT